MPNIKEYQIVPSVSRAFDASVELLITFLAALSADGKDNSIVAKTIIPLPFQRRHQKIRPIGIDRDFLKDSPFNPVSNRLIQLRKRLLKAIRLVRNILDGQSDYPTGWKGVTLPCRASSIAS